MQFRTEIIPSKLENLFNYKSTFFCIGSCFAQNIHQKLISYKFNSYENSFGIAYNPISIFENLLPTNPYQIIENNHIHYTYQAHSQVFGANQKELETKISQNIVLNEELISKSDGLIITFGTAMIYTLKSNNSIVSNCQKMPSDLFQKRLLSNEEMLTYFQLFYDKLLILNPKIKILLTISPVRHLKETLPINSVSKSILRIFCHELTQKYSNIFYFPAFEIMQDDLRDYRFYESDMLHPTNQAVDYIWQKFQESVFDPTTITNMSFFQSIQKDLLHRPFQEHTTSYLNFLIQLHEKLQKSASFVSVASEIADVSKKIKYLQTHLQA